MAQIPIALPAVVLTGLCIVVVRQGHELKNEAYRTNRLLHEIERLGKDRLNAAAACDREASPARLASRARALQLALVHPVQDRSRNPAEATPVAAQVASAPAAPDAVAVAHR